MSAPAMLGVAAATVVFALPIVGASSALEASSRASGAVDAAAIGAADALLGWIEEEPCEVARKVLEAARIELYSCEIDQEISQVRIRGGVQTIFGRVEARARAAPHVA